MSIFLSLSSGFVTVLPASIFLWMFISIVAGNENYWISYFIVSGLYLVVSLALGIFVPTLAPAHWKRHPVLWLLGQGLLAWLVAALALGLINLTPMCVGQENGDGINDFALCMAQTVMVPIACLPLEFILICLTALPGGWLIKRLVKSGAI